MALPVVQKSRLVIKALNAPRIWNSLPEDLRLAVLAKVLLYPFVLLLVLIASFIILILLLWFGFVDLC